MPKKIEIFENTLLKLLVRRGTDVDRKQVTLSEGELGYTTDTKKLYIGDGQTKGGIPIGGSSFLGSVPNVTIFTSAISGDLAYDNDDNVFYTFKGGNPANITDWQNIGGTYTAGNGTIAISNTNNITVNRLSAGNFSTNALGSGLKLDGSNKVALNSTIAVNTINIEQGSSYLNIPSNISVNSTNFVLPSYVGGPGKFLTSQYDGSLQWAEAGDNTNTIYVAGTASQIPVGTIMPFISAGSSPPGWLLCNGQSVPGSSYRELSAVIGTTYGGSSTDFNVPNFVNKAIYGVESSPSTSTTFRLASGSNSSLSASGALYIIKAKPDTVVNSTITVRSPLSATLDGTTVTNTAVNSLRGNLTISAPNLSSGIVNAIFPINSIYLTFTSANPGTWLGGTWEQESTGLFLVGVGSDNDKNGTVRTFVAGGDGNTTLGEYTHVLTEAEIPAHSHLHGVHIQSARSANVYGATQSGTPGLANGSVDIDAIEGDPNQGYTSTIGSSQSHNNIPPCFGIYVWRRSA